MTMVTRKADGKSAAASIEIHYVRAEPVDDAGDPTVLFYSESQ